MVSFKTHPFFKHLRSKVYGSESKKINNLKIKFDLYEDLHSLGISIIFMDDGSYHKQNKTYTISAMNEVKKKHLKRRLVELGINALFNSIGIYIPVREKIKFKKLIEHHIVPCMRYKLG